MIDNGYSLNDIELLNWGNFHGYQKFSLRGYNENGGLFAPPQASAILGVNGSGKTTLIDALMITLLPFENSVKLGVTNDYETGAGGGRTIRDYVLGKYSSTQNTQADPESIYGRKSGCSAIVLKFQHNQYPQRFLSLGRIWWFSNYKVSDTQIGFLSFDPLKISDLCLEGKLPKSPKAFKQHLKGSALEVQEFETMQSYFSALSSALGGVSRNDLKLLNRAFYVKSISQIDPFIKENMLLSVENPHLERLLENVRNGQEIASAIETCEKKLLSIGRILKELERIGEIEVDVKKQQREQELLGLLPDFLELEEFRNQLKNDRLELEKAQASSPDLKRQQESLELDLYAVRSQIAANDVANQVELFERQVQHLTEKISWSENLIKRWAPRLKPFKIDLLKTTHNQETLFSKLSNLKGQHQRELQFKEQELEKKRHTCFELENKSKALREEIEHLTRSGSLIPQRIYEVKERAIKELHIPDRDLRFFAELVQVKKEFQKYRRPVEAVFFGVARNLLCHPKYLKKLTDWLDTNGFKADITVKRITEGQLQTESAKPELILSKSILHFIEILPAEDHPFGNYLNTWCSEVFNYQLVEVSEFKGSEPRQVTLDGLIKQDSKTMRKLKENFAYSLGWETQSVVEQKTQELVQCGQDYQKQRDVLGQLEKSHSRLTTETGFLEELLTSQEDLDMICSKAALSQQKQEILRSLNNLQASHPEFQSLKERLEKLSLAQSSTQKKLAEVEVRIQEFRERIKKTESILPLREQSFVSSKPFLAFVSSFKSAEAVFELLKERQTRLVNAGQSRLEASSEVSDQIKILESRRNSSIARSGSLLNEHYRNFSDPGVSYQLKFEQLDILIESWQVLRDQLERTELPKAKEKWQRFFDQVLIDSVKDTLNEIKVRLREIGQSIESINLVLKLTNFEELPSENRYLQIVAESSSDDRIRRFRKTMQSLELVLGPSVRIQELDQSGTVMSVLVPFVEEFQKEPHYRAYVTDVRNHFQFQVDSLRRVEGGEDQVAETFSGAKKDAKSSAQTTQLAYALLASSLAYRFRFHDPQGGQDTLRLIVLDEFGGKFDNEKPREIVKLLNKMGFQSVLLSPMSKADLLAESIGQMVLVHKLSASHSKVKSFEINSLEDYQSLIQSQFLKSPVQDLTKEVLN